MRVMLDFKQECRAVIQSLLAKFDLVTREEFDIQKKVLEKTRQKVTELEKELKNHAPRDSV